MSLLLVRRDWKGAMDGKKALDVMQSAFQAKPSMVSTQRQEELDALYRHLQRAGDLPLELRA